jgi:hypothetical protein
MKKFLVLVVMVVVATMAVAPAQALFPERYSIVFFDITGALLECVDFTNNCTDGTCQAKAFFAGKNCSYDQVVADHAGPGRTSTTMTCNNIVYGGLYAARTVISDINCSRKGEAWYRFTAGTFGPGSCGAEVYYKNMLGIPGFNQNEGQGGVTIAGVAPNGRGTCANLFSPASPYRGVESRRGK